MHRGGVSHITTQKLHLWTEVRIWCIWAVDLGVHIVKQPDACVCVTSGKNPGQPTANETGTAGDENMMIGHGDFYS
jgi:hypothetical protein